MLATTGENPGAAAKTQRGQTQGSKIRKKRYGSSLNVHPRLKGMWCNTCPVEDYSALERWKAALPFAAVEVNPEDMLLRELS